MALLIQPEHFPRRELPPRPWRWTDDTAMAVSVVETLSEHGGVEQDDLATRFAERFIAEPGRGYGQGAQGLLSQMAAGASWSDVAPAMFAGTGSFGNGAAMRVAPLGAWYAGRPELAAREADLSAAVTHAHPEGRAGAVAVAVAASLAAEGGLRGGDFIEAIMGFVPESRVRMALAVSRTIDACEVERAVSVLGSGAKISAYDTVPFCIWVAAHRMHDYEEALWTTISGWNDGDTTCAIVGGIVAIPSGGPPEHWRSRREPLPIVTPRSRR